MSHESAELAEEGLVSPSGRGSSPCPDHESDPLPPFVLKFRLHCRSTDSCEEATLKLPSPPRTVVDVKTALEAECSIPACIQQLQFESATLRDAESLANLHVRSGDRLSVAYKAPADCTAIKEAIAWMNSVVELLEEETPAAHTSRRVLDLIISGYQACIMENLAFKRFSPWVSPVVQVNKLYFLQEGGLELLLKLFGLVLNVPWPVSPREFKYVEHICMTVVSNLASSLELRRLIVNHGIILMCLQSLLRVKLSQGQPVVDDTGSLGVQHINDGILQDTMRSDVAMIAKYVSFGGHIIGSWDSSVCGLCSKHSMSCSNLESGSTRNTAV